tara:strand:- start:281 stop:1585 length:1305 start_codon:yes stop_codon:yes gene_type:complete
MHQRRGLLFAASWSDEYTKTHRIKHSTKQVPLEGTIRQITLTRDYQPQGVAPPTERHATFRYYDLTLTMSPLSDDWDLLFTVSPTNPEDPHGSEAIVKENPLMESMAHAQFPTHFHDHCDHCESGRRGRHKTMTFRHKETDEVVSVGSSCVLEYTGIDPTLVESILEFKGKATTHDFDTSKRGVVRSMTTYEFALRASMWLHSNSGYARGLGHSLFDFDLIKHPQTGQIGFGYRQLVPKAHIIAAPAGGITEPVGFQWLREDEPVAPEVISPSVFTVAEAFMDYCLGLSGSSSFEHTVRNIFKSGVVSKKGAAMAGGALAGYLKHIQREARRTAEVERKAAAPAGKHLGTVGDRMDFGNATVVFVRRIEGYYGTTTLTKFLAGDDTLVWFRSGDKSDLKVGDTVSITGTVKKHDQFKDEKQTVITRAKFTRGEE